MKQLKSSAGDLRQLFARTPVLRDLAEPLASFDDGRPAGQVRAFMDARGYDVSGLRESGMVTGYVSSTELSTGAAKGYHLAFEACDVLPASEPLLAAFGALRERRHVFITLLGHVDGIVTRGDLQKTPVRLWLLGLISSLEIQMLRVVGLRYPGGSRPRLPTSKRLQTARNIFAKRQLCNEETDLADCLQPDGKAANLTKDSGLFALSHFASKQKWQDFFNTVESLQNTLAHTNDILTGHWPALADLIGQLEGFFLRLEGVK